MYINILRIHLFMTITNLNSACRTCRSAVFVAVQPRSVLDFNVPGLHRTILTGSRVGGHRASHYRYMTMIISPTRQQRSGRDAAFCTWRVRHSTGATILHELSRCHGNGVSAVLVVLSHAPLIFAHLPTLQRRQTSKLPTRGMRQGWVVHGGGGKRGGWRHLSSLRVVRIYSIMLYETHHQFIFDDVNPGTSLGRAWYKVVTGQELFQGIVL